MANRFTEIQRNGLCSVQSVLGVVFRCFRVAFILPFLIGCVHYMEASTNEENVCEISAGTIRLRVQLKTFFNIGLLYVPFIKKNVVVDLNCTSTSDDHYNCRIDEQIVCPRDTGECSLTAEEAEPKILFSPTIFGLKREEFFILYERKWHYRSFWAEDEYFVRTLEWDVTKHTISYKLHNFRGVVSCS